MDEGRDEITTMSLMSRELERLWEVVNSDPDASLMDTYQWALKRIEKIHDALLTPKAVAPAEQKVNWHKLGQEKT